MSRLVIRADANQEIGLGHVMRSMALGQHWKDRGGEVIYCTRCESPSIRERIIREGFQLLELPVGAGGEGEMAMLADLTAHPATFRPWFMLDGYHFGRQDQRALAGRGARVLYMDDTQTLDPTAVNLVVNPNPDAVAADYARVSPSARLLLGARYALLRREFRRARPPQATAAKASRVLITLGGSDPHNKTLDVIRALDRVSSCKEAHVVVGPANPHGDALRGAARRAACDCRVLLDADMVSEMAWADTAVSAGGSTCWELACFGIPTITIETADNQRNFATALAARGGILNLGWHEGLSVEQIGQALESLMGDAARRDRQGEALRALVNGRGVERITAAMKELSLALEPMTARHCQRVWEWANEPSVRAASFESAAIPFERHVSWFHRKLADPACTFLLATSDRGLPIGQVRFEHEAEDATISISVDPGIRRQGYGSALVRKATALIFARRTARRVHAYIRTGNEASIRTFQEVGYGPFYPCQVKGQAAVQATCERSVA